MNFRIIILLVCFPVIHCQAQQKGDMRKVLKVYNLSSFSQGSFVNSDSISTNTNSNSNLQIVHPTVAFAWKTRNGNYHEIELVNAVINRTMHKSTFNTSSNPNIKSILGGVSNTTYIGMRYEFIYEFMKETKSDFTTSLGFAALPNFIFSKGKSFSSFDFPSKYSGIGISAFVVPRLNYKINERSFVNLNIPFSLIMVNYVKSTVRNPAVSLKEQSVTEWYSSVLPQTYFVRIGYGYRIE